MSIEIVETKLDESVKIVKTKSVDNKSLKTLKIY